MNGQPLRLNVCNRDGSCIRVDLPRPVLVEGVVVNVMAEDVTELCERLQCVADELELEDQTPWENNFDLKKLRKRQSSER